MSGGKVPVGDLQLHCVCAFLKGGHAIEFSKGEFGQASHRSYHSIDVLAVSLSAVLAVFMILPE